MAEEYGCVGQGCTNFSTVEELCKSSRGHCEKFSHHGDVVPGCCASL